MNEKILAYLRKADDLVAGKAVAPVTCEIDPSNRCQCACSYCISAGVERCDLPYNVFENVAIDLFTMGCRSITFTGGGEPLMNADFSRMAETSRALGFRLGLVTNGINLDKIFHIAHWFDFIRVSIDAGDRETYKAVRGVDYFDEVSENVAATMSVLNKTERKTTVGLSCVICDTNQDRLDAVGALGERLGVDYVQYKPAIGTKGPGAVPCNGRTIYTERFQATKVSCAIAGLIGIVGADSKYYFCCNKRGKKEFAVADLRKKTLAEAVDARTLMNPDISGCSFCRYSNYEQEYRAKQGKKFAYLRHIEFL